MSWLNDKHEPLNQTHKQAVIKQNEAFIVGEKRIIQKADENQAYEKQGTCQGGNPGSMGTTVKNNYMT